MELRVSFRKLVIITALKFKLSPMNFVPNVHLLSSAISVTFCLNVDEISS